MATLDAATKGRNAMTPIGNRIVNVERNCGYSREQLAEIVGVPEQELTRAMFGRALDDDIQARIERWFPTKRDFEAGDTMTRQGPGMI